MEDVRAVPFHEHGLAARDDDGRTPLHFAARRGNIKLADYCLDTMPLSSADQVDNSGQSPFHCAVESKRTDIIQVFQRQGMDVHKKDRRGRSILHQAALHDNVDALKQVMAITGPEGLEVRDNDERTPFELADRYNSCAVVQHSKSAHNLAFRTRIPRVAAVEPTQKLSHELKTEPSGLLRRDKIKGYVFAAFVAVFVLCCFKDYGPRFVWP